MPSIVSDCLKEIRERQRASRAAGDVNGAIAAYDSLVGELLDRIERMDERERVSLFESLSGEGSGLLFGAARSAAERAVREQNPARLGIGIRTLLAEDCKDDYRETLMHLTMLDNSARKLGVSLEESYLIWRSLARSETQKLIDQYFSCGGSTLDAMGFIETRDKNGEFAYQRTW